LNFYYRLRLRVLSADNLWGMIIDDIVPAQKLLWKCLKHWRNQFCITNPLRAYCYLDKKNWWVNQ